MIPRYIVTASLLILSGCSSPKYKNPHIEIQTRIGNIEVELFAEQAPQTVAAIISYIDSGLYKDASFYRVLSANNQPSDAPKAELIQGGLWAKKSTGPELPGIKHESTRQTGILHTNGVISLARRERGTASTEFFYLYR